jgi:hypothetical protein
MTPAERERLFARVRGRILRDQVGLMTGTRDELFRLLKEAQAAIVEQLADQPTDYQRWSLPQLSAQIRQVMDQLARDAGGEIASASAKAWETGQQSLDEPLAQAGVRIATQLPQIDTRQLAAIRAFTVDRIKDIAADGANKIIAELGLVVIGARSPSEAIGAVKKILGEKSRDRARTIVRTELGRLYETAAHERRLEAAKILPGLKKQWRRSGKLHPRLHHDLADGQLRDVDEPFILTPFGKPRVELMYPKDPAAPAGETINCGCTAISFMASWEVKHPGRVPGSPLLDDAESVTDILARQKAKEPA